MSMARMKLPTSRRLFSTGVPAASGGVPDRFSDVRRRTTFVSDSGD
ncbi:hypothetical protein M6B38_354900 [Iris pallida]|uniref:Uncharacterized protein n=1 Tax=Iris pallida TaxID=29817 RepID=A0AAX6ECY2_IRIPA|nr:hypothetical protein M6B38_245475 [Iris pallida]KAJ6801801.1 hypothetical protein M6B38_196170 [Iris pallida]KAJ6801802.1 hypothetical protein M6B38_196175 [Iris pallida]KAJ6830210.1 hypothetical protein M6B38_354900 [Iris pallida]